jgi:hypothetical protein
MMFPQLDLLEQLPMLHHSSYKHLFLHNISSGGNIDNINRKEKNETYFKSV